MCGIVGYIRPREVQSILADGLRNVEYRGCDSAVVVVLGDDGLEALWAKGKLSKLIPVLVAPWLASRVGIGHTSCATHGKASVGNAHPHRFGRVAAVHNASVENLLALHEEFRASGHVFASPNDTETFAHLIVDALPVAGGDLSATVRAPFSLLRGTYPLVVLSENDPTRIIAAKNALPLVAVVGKGKTQIASDVPAMLELTSAAIFLEEGKDAELTADGVRITDFAGRPGARRVSRLGWSPLMAEKGAYKHFMHEAIHEHPGGGRQPERLRCDGRRRRGPPRRPVARSYRFQILACGNNWHPPAFLASTLSSCSDIPNAYP